MTVVILVGVLGAVEIGAVALLGHRFLPGVVAWSIDAVSAAAYLALLVLIGSVLVRRHRITSGSAHLVLGYLGSVTVALTDITDVQRIGPLPVTHADQTGALWAEETLSLVASASVDRVRVALGRPVQARRLWQRRPVHEVIVGAEDEGFAQTLADAIV